MSNTQDRAAVLPEIESKFPTIPMKFLFFGTQGLKVDKKRSIQIYTPQY